MEIFLRLVQGSYAYLLVFQILVVTGLVLALIGLVVRRTREAHAPRNADGTAMAPQTIVVTAPNAADEAKIVELESKLKIAEEEVKQLKSSTGDVKTMKEKIKYLESKLLEYEILQEEIGTLSALKVENEQLKQQIQANKTAPKQRPLEREILVEPDAPTAVPAMTVFFDAPATADPATAGSAQESGEAAATGLENLLQQIDSLGSPADKEKPG